MANWTRLLKTAWRVRRLQRYFGHLGQFLQGFGAETRERLKSAYPLERSGNPAVGGAETLVGTQPLAGPRHR